ncbi:MAG: integrase family protein, partial [Gemmataceae bacterium]|nr:integrase family protein [Gemmataceae bacterium]
MPDDPNRIRVGDRVTIYPRGVKKTWVADFWQENVHRKVSLKTSNKKVAVERATKLAADLTHGTYLQPPPAVTVRQAIDDYMLYLKTEDRARKTVVKYRGVFDLFMAYLDRHRVTRLGQVTAGHFDRYRAERKEIRHQKTIYCEGVIIKQLFKWARSRKLIADNPLADIQLNKPPLEPKDGPSLAQVNAILAAADDPLLSQLPVLAFTGMRAGEIQRLRPEDVDLSAGWIHIRSRPGAQTKTRESRKVPIHPRLRAVLETLSLARRPWLFTAAPSKKFPDGGHHINVKRLNEQFTRLVGRLGMPVGRANGFVIHSLRHFFETFTVNAGIPQRVID